MCCLVSPISDAREELGESILFSFFPEELLNKTKALLSSKDQLFSLCGVPCLHLILQWPLKLLCPSCVPLDFSCNPHLSPLHFLVGFEVFMYFSIFYSGAALLKGWCEQTEKNRCC